MGCLPHREWDGSHSLVGYRRALCADRDILAYAAAHDYVVFTHDLDFGTILALGKLPGPSVIQLRSQEVLPAEVGEMVVRALTAASAHLHAGALVTIDPVRHRIRMLPF